MIKISKPSIGQEEIEAVREVLESGWLGRGHRSIQFEAACGRLIGCRHFLGLSSGTKALEVAFLAAGCRPGDEVLTPSLTYAAAIQTILNLSLVPVFVDANREDGNICVEDALRKITPKTRFILPVHFRGRSCDMDALNNISERRRIRIIEDAAHAFASRHKGTFIGRSSFMACFSFGPIKNITCGGGGGIATNDESVARFITNYRNMGISRSTWERFDEQEMKNKGPWDYQVIGPGGRCHLPEMNAAVGLAQLKKLETFRAKKQRIIQIYQEELAAVEEVETLTTNIESDFLYIYPILVPKKARAGLMQQLIDKGIHTTIHYPANHRQPFFRKYCHSRLKTTEALSERLISLPSFTDLAAEQQYFVIDQIKDYFKA